MKTAVLFDMDGVLIDTETVYARCLSMAFQEKGYSIPASDFYLSLIHISEPTRPY